MVEIHCYLICFNFFGFPMPSLFTKFISFNSVHLKHFFNIQYLVKLAHLGIVK